MDTRHYRKKEVGVAACKLTTVMARRKPRSGQVLWNSKHGNACTLAGWSVWLELLGDCYCCPSFLFNVLVLYFVFLFLIYLLQF